MTYLHCQVRFQDYKKWKASMDADSKAQKAVGLHLINLWRGTEDTNIAFFVMEVEDIAKARAFLDPVEIGKAADAAGASDFQWYFTEKIV